MSKNVSRRRWLSAGAATAAAAVTAGGLAFAQSGSQAPAGYKFKGRALSAGELSRTSEFVREEEPVYFATDCGPDSDKVQVYRSMDDFAAEYRGTIVSNSIEELKARIRRTQETEGTITDAEIRTIQSQQSFLINSPDQMPSALTPGNDSSTKFSFLPRGQAGWLYEHDNFEGRSIGFSIAMPDAGWVGFNNTASSAKFSGFAMFSDLTWYRGSKLVLLFFYTAHIPALSVYRTPAGVSWNDLISSWTVLSY